MRSRQKAEGRKQIARMLITDCLITAYCLLPTAYCCPLLTALGLSANLC